MYILSPASVDADMIREVESGMSSRKKSSRFDDDDMGGDDLAEGSKVEARYRGGSRYYKGKITRKRLNGTFDILYDDGEKEMGVDKEMIKSAGGGGGSARKSKSRMDSDDDMGGDDLAEGSKVEARYRGGSRYYKGKITRKRLNGTFDILYDDGEKEMGVDKEMIKSAGGGGSARFWLW
jgi:hypothetical protein